MANSGKRRYVGSIEDLMTAVAHNGVNGRWEERIEPPLHMFRATTGEVLNWWPRRGTLQFQGRVSPEFVAGVTEYLGGSIRKGPLRENPSQSSLF